MKSNRNPNKKISNRSLSSFEQEIMGLMKEEQIPEGLMNLKNKAKLLVERAKTESANTHPVYLTLLYIVSAQLCAFSENEAVWATRSVQYAKFALSYMQKHQEVIESKSDNEWQLHRSRLLDIFNHYFLLVLNKISDSLCTHDVAAILEIICADSYETESQRFLALAADERQRGIKFFYLMRSTLQIIWGGLSDISKLPHFYSVVRFVQSGTTFYLLNLIEKSVWKSLVDCSKIFGEMDWSVFSSSVVIANDVKHAVGHCNQYINARIQQKDPVPTGISHLPRLIALANRLAFIRMRGECGVYEVFSKLLHIWIAQNLRKKNDNPLDHLWLQQFNFDWMHVFSGEKLHSEQWQNKNQLISKYLAGQAITQDNLALHLVTVWHGIVSITNRLLIVCVKGIKKRPKNVAIENSFEQEYFEQLSMMRARSGELIISDFVDLETVQQVMHETYDVLLTTKTIVNKITRSGILDHSDMKVLSLMPFLMNNVITPGIFKFFYPGCVVNAQDEVSMLNHYEFAKLLIGYSKDLSEVLLFISEYPMLITGGAKKALEFKRHVQDVIEHECIIYTQLMNLIDHTLLTHDDRFQESIKYHQSIACRFVQEQEDKRQIKQEKRKAKLKSQQKLALVTERILKKDIISQADFERDDKMNPQVSLATKEDLAEAMLQEALNWYSKKYYYKARACYGELAQIHSDYQLQSMEGVFVCQTRIVTKQLMQLKKQLQIVVSYHGKIFPDQVEVCYNEIDRLQVECAALNVQYEKVKQAMQNHDATTQSDLAHLQNWQEDFESAWKEVVATKKSVIEKLNQSRYEKIMELGFEAHGITDGETKTTLLQLGLKEHVQDDQDHKQKPNSQFQLVYDAGYNAFAAKGAQNYDKFGESPYASMRALLQNLDGLVQTARKKLERHHRGEAKNNAASSSASASLSVPNDASSSSYNSSLLSASETTNSHIVVKSSAVTASNSNAPHMNAPSSEIQVEAEPFSKTMSAQVLLKELSEFKMFADSEKAVLAAWTKANAAGLSKACREGQVDANFAYECFSGFVLTKDLKANIVFLNETGLLRWFLSVPGEGRLIPAGKMNVVNQRLQKIAESIIKTPSSDWKVDLILAQVLATILMESVNQKWLLDNLMNFGLVDKPLCKMCEALQLSATCLSALHAYLVTYVRLKYFPKPHMNQTVQALDVAVQQYNEPLLVTANVETTPVCAVIYGSSAYIHLIQTDHIPADIDIRTNLPLAKWPFEKILHQHLAEHQIYQRYFEDGHIGNGVSIKLDDAPIMNVMQVLDFTISQAMFHVGLGSMVYWTNAAYEDLFNNKVLSFVKPAGALYEDPQLILRVLIAGNNTKFYLHREDAAKLTALLAIECESARREKRNFLKPVIDPGCLLHFLFTYCIYRSAEQYLTLAMHYGTLPLLLPVPFDTSSLFPVDWEQFRASLQKFDEERLASEPQNPDGWMLLGKLIALVFNVLISSCKDNRTLMNDALKELTHFFPNNPKILSAVSHYSAFYGPQHVTSSSMSLPSLVFAKAASEGDVSLTTVTLQRPLCQHQ